MKLFDTDSEVTEALIAKGLHSWATLYTMAQSGQVAKIGNKDLEATYYKAAHFYKCLKHADWGHPNPGRARLMPVSTNLQVGQNSTDAAEAINQLAVSVNRRNLKPAQLRGLEKLGTQLLGLAQSTLQAGKKEPELRKAS